MPYLELQHGTTIFPTSLSLRADPDRGTHAKLVVAVGKLGPNDTQASRSLRKSSVELVRAPGNGWAGLPGQEGRHAIEYMVENGELAFTAQRLQKLKLSTRNDRHMLELLILIHSLSLSLRISLILILNLNLMSSLSLTQRQAYVRAAWK